MDPIRVYLVDDSQDFLEAVARFLGSDSRVDIIGQSQSGEDAIQQVPMLKPDLVLMDLAMPDMNGLETTRRIKAGPDAPRIIILTLHDNTEYRAAASSVEADGFIAKSELGVQLLPMITSLFYAADPAKDPHPRP
jgi:DNA-binding NarL/FixJ family response regulator